MASSAPTLLTLDKTEAHSFMTPIQRIRDGEDVSAFLTSHAYRDLVTFLLQLNASMFPRYVHSSGSTKIQVWGNETPGVPFSKTVVGLRNLLCSLSKIIDMTPLDTGPRRFGNAAFKVWHDTVKIRVDDLLTDNLPAEILSFQNDSKMVALDELRAYFLGSFGSPQRLDYGTGHELSFLAFLGCIWKLGGFNTSSSGEEERGIVIGVIDLYLQIIRQLIKRYTLEPAGSHGVWGLDDHSFLPYIFGSAQYGPPIGGLDQIPTEGSRDGAPDPGNVAKADLVEKERTKNMYFGAIGFIYDVKKGPFWEHSPTLYDISGVRAGWAKINKGMIKMYIAEVLSKVPVVQHFPFGSLFSWEQDPNAVPPTTSIHASSQPTRTETGSTSFNVVSMRVSAQESTRSPREPMHAALPDPVRETRAPWASKQPLIIPSTSDAASSAPSVRRESGRTKPPPALIQDMASTRPPNGAGSSQDVKTSMPPPTKAPWAK